MLCTKFYHNNAAMHTELPTMPTLLRWLVNSAHDLIESVVFPTKKTSEFLENPRLHSHRSAGLPGSKKSPDLSSQE